MAPEIVTRGPVEASARPPSTDRTGGPAPRVRVLEFVTGLFVGGTERHVAELTRLLDPSTFELHLACLDRSGPLLPEFQARGLEPQEFRVQRLYGPGAWAGQLRLASWLRRRRMDVVHAYGFYANVFAVPAARLAGVPVVLASVRDTGDHLTPLQRTAQRLVCRMADRVLANAGAVRARLVREGYYPARIQVIPNGVDLTRFAAARRPWRGRAELGVAPDAPLVAVAARLDPLKGIEHFVDAAALLARRFPGVVFVVVGAGEPASLLARSARLGLHGRLAFTGHRDDVAELLADAAVSVLPSLSEGHSNSLLESMAAGAPVVATRVGGNVETVADGVTGLLVPPGVPAALAEAIGSLLADPARAAAMGRAGRRRAAERYSVGTMIEATQSLYLDLAGRRRRDERESAGAALRERSQGALAGERT